MSNVVIVIPVKNPEGAKQRLKDVLSAEQRFELATTLFVDVLNQINKLPSKPDCLVVTDDDRISNLAVKHGAEVLIEENPQGETKAVEFATALSVQNGYTRQVVIPGDMAYLDIDEMEQLLATKLDSPSVVYCPAVGDDGTNAIYSTPPNAVSFRFGDRSFPDYIERAKDNNVNHEVLRLKSLVLDIDTPNDLKTFLDLKLDNAATTLLNSWGFHQGADVHG
ncbi:MAG: 2-phospho-L-lactate guanylyltransferase [Candidatus Lindowbacteria bacterium]|nr:2-phospho-L-lactate guanylyltransferase [Candidatus Lindowbacteria bacterium]